MSSIIPYFRLKYHSFVAWLEHQFFPVVIAYATHPLTIFLTILLLIPLLLFGNFTGLELILGNYTNVTSAAVASIVLLQTARHHRANQKLHADHAEEIRKLHVKIDSLTKKKETHNDT